ncbi:hypothetical protein HYE24_00840 [Mycoplasmopsis bovis]|nr:hypothetical protein [Mycoplasmopsis bovis]QQH23616.1 hypothetical protein HYE24_00840 [Mycoplasmopsis bovis]
MDSALSSYNYITEIQWSFNKKQLLRGRIIARFKTIENDKNTKRFPST